MSLPYPPFELANRVGSIRDEDDPWASYDATGQRSKEDIVGILPRDWSFENRRVLDFGCGAGRTLRHFVTEAEVGEFWGCDIDVASIQWLRQNLLPPFHVFPNSADPHLPITDSSFDLVYAVSVFTHLTETWSSWLLELHRILKEEALLIATFMGEGVAPVIAGEEWDDALFGMNVLRYGQSWDDGGPMVFHAPWWIRSHWGRLFDVVELRPDGFAGWHQGIVVLRRRAVQLTRDEVEHPEPDEPREFTSLLHQRQQLFGEIVALRAQLNGCRDTPTPAEDAAPMAEDNPRRRNPKPSARPPSPLGVKKLIRRLRS